MYNYGAEGNQPLLDNTLNYSTSQKMGLLDDVTEELSPRGEEHTQLIQFLTSSLLRTGFTLQAASLFCMLVIYLAFGGSGIFIFDLYAGPEGVKTCSTFHLIISILLAVYLFGSLSIALFHVFLADNSKLSRGFRAGSKALGAAVTLDIISTSLRFVQYVYAFSFMEMIWWAKYHQTRTDWSLFQFGSSINVLSLFLYAMALFYMEAYHDEGAAEELGWLNLTLFSLAAFSELLMIFTGFGAFFSLFLLIALISAAMWASSFEPLAEKHSPNLHSRDINSDVLPDAVSAETLATEEDYNNLNKTGVIPSNYAIGNIGADNIPTSFDYTQMNQQVQQEIEMGVVGTSYPQYAA